MRTPFYTGRLLPAPRISERRGSREERCIIIMEYIKGEGLLKKVGGANRRYVFDVGHERLHYTYSLERSAVFFHISLSASIFPTQRGVITIATAFRTTCIQYIHVRLCTFPITAHLYHGGLFLVALRSLDVFTVSYGSPSKPHGVRHSLALLTEKRGTFLNLWGNV